MRVVRTGDRPLAGFLRTASPHWAALSALALFLAAGLAAADDYGVTKDSPIDADIALTALSFAAGVGDRFSSEPFYFRLYGPTFEWALLFAKFAFGLEDSRGVYLSRYVILHLTYLASGLFAYLLVLRLSGARWAALFAMLALLSHPRLYAHSFFSSKDMAFFAALTVALYLTHRAFRRDNVSAFVLLGVGVGALVNLRIMGIILLAAIPALRALDFAFAQGWAERKRILITTGAFALACGLAAYALLPYLWGDPVGRAVEWWTTLSAHPNVISELFRGTVYSSADLPAEYIPVWFAIASPPFALLLGLMGGAAILAGAVGRPGGALRNTRLRFGLALAGCFALPVVGALLLDANTHDRGRHMYFLWAPFSMLAAFGLLRLTLALRRARLRAAVYGAAGAGVAAALVASALLHPNQYASFNFFVDRVKPEGLWTEYALALADHPMRQALERVADQRPTPGIAAVRAVNLGGVSTLDPLDRQAQILPRDSRARIATAPADPDALAFLHGPAPESGRVLHRIELYGNTLLTIERKADLRAAYESATRREPTLRSALDVHYVDGALVYVKEPCEWDEVADGHFKLWVVPEERADLPDQWKPVGYELLIFYFPVYGALFDGKCAASVPLPAYPVAAVRTGQATWGEGGGETLVWDSAAVLDPGAWRAHRTAVASREPVARAAFDLHLDDDGALVYVKEPCSQADTKARFFLHVAPERPDDLPKDQRVGGFENWDFDFFTRGGHFDGACLARVPLPDYPVTSARTGQFSGGKEIWSVTIPFP